MSAPVSPAARYRYRDEAPETLSLPVDELLGHLPSDCRRGLPEQGRRVEVPCRELFSGNTPRVGLAVLKALLPELLEIPQETAPETRIQLPPGWLAAHFRFVPRRIDLPAEPGDAAAKPPVEPTKGTDTLPKSAEPAGEVVKTEGVAEPTPIPAENPSEKTAEAAVRPSEAADASTESGAEPQRKGFFESLPTFRRREADPETPQTSSATPANEDSSPGKALTLERLWKLDPQDQLADPGALQALFMTEEKLTLESVLSLAGQLPGLSACVLAHGDQVVCTSKATSGVDLRTLSGHAMTMLSQIRESSSKMGLGAVPAVTLHAEQGVLSFLHNGELCLLVLHADRGFVPGVRERLQEMLGHLTEARPALPERSPAEEMRGVTVGGR